MSEPRRDVRLVVIDRLLQERALDTAVILRAPCIFCGYRGQGYWKAGTHAESCPVGSVAGIDRDVAVLAVIADAQKAGV